MSDIKTHTVNVSVLQRRMATQQIIEQQLNNIIRNMRDLVDDTNITKSQMKQNQMTNLRTVSLDTPSVELVKVYIQYQIGRDEREDNWRYANFGEKLISQLDGLHQEAVSTVRQVNETLGFPETQTPNDKDVEAVWIDLARHYIGQLNRYFYYRKG